MEFEGEDYYPESDEGDYTDEDEEFNNYDLEEENLDEEKNYTILKPEDIRPRLEDDIAKILSLLSVSRESAVRLLCRSNWSVNNVHEQWFSDEEKIRKACGLLETYPMIEKTLENKFFCGICFESHGNEEAVSAACGHLFCKTCWQTYIRISINDGRGCLMLRCPQSSCGMAVGQDMINSLASEEEKEKYDNYLVRSYIEDKKNIKWCPAPGCNFAIEFVRGSNTNFEVTCSCSYGFCWNCSEEAHSPADCESVAKWMLKNWILCNSKPCPDCRKPIEKNQGCMHMTCICSYEFCWLCLGPWSEHNRSTGGFTSCNKYGMLEKEGSYYEAERKREKAKYYLERYTHYYERWAGNNSSRERALLDMKEFQTEHLKELSRIQAEPEVMLKFIIDAWDQIVECRRVLKWSYVYGYYMPIKEHAKKELFEYLQGEAEIGLERLHDCAENELWVYLKREGPSESFNDFRKKLVGLTSVTRTYFDNLVRALGNDLSEVNSLFVARREAPKRFKKLRD